MPELHFVVSRKSTLSAFVSVDAQFSLQMAFFIVAYGSEYVSSNIFLSLVLL